MEPLPLQPLSQSAPVFKDYGTNPLEVLQGRAAAEQKQANIEAAKKAAEDKIKQDKAAANKPEFGNVYMPHTNEYLGMVNAYNQWHANKMIEAQRAGDKNIDPNEPGSQANLEDLARQAAVKQYSKSSEFLQKRFEDFHNDYVSNPGKYTPDDYAAMVESTNASPYEYIAGKRQLPEIIGYWNKEDVISKAFAPLKAAGWENSVYDESNDMFIDTGGSGISEDRIKQQAFAVSAPGTQSGSRWEREVQSLPDIQRKALEAEASKLGVTPAQVKAYKDMKSLAYNQYTEDRSNANLKSSKWGSGWGNDKIVADRIVSLMQGVSTGDPKIFDKLDIPWNTQLEERGDIGKQRSKIITDEMQGMPLSPVMENGKEVPVTFGEIEIIGDQAIVKRKRADGGEIEPLKMKTEDFASTMTEEIIEGSPELKRGMLYEVMNERGMIDPKSGYIKAGQTNTKKQGAFTPGITPKPKGAFMPGITK